ncbi:MAG: FkbM family methyltransferase [Candidatus Pacebacteria bacterium]|nr:FkbM family methyltransferase [Candidatus Paceibacterota bacterium]
MNNNFFNKSFENKIKPGLLFPTIRLIMKFISFIGIFILKKINFMVVLSKLRNTKQVLYVELSSAVGLSIWFRGVYELKNTLLIQKILSSGDIFFDIGGNAGYFSVIASPIVGPAGSVHYFEPNPKLCALFKRSLEKNEISNVKIVPKAVMSNNGKVKFLSMKDSGLSRIVIDPKVIKNNQKNKLTTVPSITIDDYCQLNMDTKDCPKLIKIDVEGAELNVLQGAKQTLKRHQPIIFAEIQNITLNKFGATATKLFKFMSSLGYKGKDPNTQKEITNPENLAWPNNMVLFTPINYRGFP